MAVEIPVVVDIDQAFADAARRAPAAMKKMQVAIDENILEIPIEINKKGDVAEVLDFVGKTKMSMDNLRYAIRSASSELARLKRKGASQDDIAAYEKAIILLKSIRMEWEENEREAKRTGDAQLRNVQITREYETALRLAADSINDINAKIAAYTAMLNNSDIGSAKFIAAARNLGAMSRKMQEVQSQVQILGTKTGSIDNLSAQIQRLNRLWGEMSAKKKFASDGSMTAEAKALYAEYKRVSEELRKQGMTMSDLAKKEQERADKHRKFLKQRQKENNILKSTQQTVAMLEAKLNILQQRLAKTPVGTAAFNKLNQQLRQTRVELDAVRARIDGVNSELNNTHGTLGRLLKRTAYFFGLTVITRFIRNIRQVTAEFEMQRVALGGIIHDTEKANALFRQIKAAAIESPFQIKELVTFTKQLSAYRVETENLFDITMKLADVSAGLGVDMNRLVLAYGQVKAASVLRGQELRQFTEAGIPLVELLAKKFSDLNGKMVSTSEVFELISKRAVPFEMIAEIFDDMTSAGGVFYKMQEKQAETLQGQWSNLRDAISIMYDEMGNTEKVHKAMEAVINDAKYLMQNWRSIATILKYVGIQFATVKIASLFMPTLTYNTKLAEKATIALANASRLEALQQTESNRIRAITIRQLTAYSERMTRAAAAQTIMGRTLNKVAAGFLGGGWIGLATTAVSVLIGVLVSARNEANRLSKELEKIGTEGSMSINRSVSNFVRLADAAVKAADGSDEQSRALEELQRTYSDIIPSQNLQIEKLRELNNDYRSLTAAIEEKINMQIREQKINATTDYYAGKIQKGRKRSKNLLEAYGLDKEQINAVLDEIQRLVDDGTLKTSALFKERADIISDAIKRLTGQEIKLYSVEKWGQNNQFTREVQSKASVELYKLVDIYAELGEKTQEIEDDMSSAIGSMGEYAYAWENLKKEIKEVTVSEEQFGKKSTFSYKKEKLRKEVEIMAKAIEDAFKDTGIDISDAFEQKGAIDFKKLIDAAGGSTKYGLQNYIKNIQKSYESIVPSDQMVGVIERKFGELASSVGLSMDEVQGYLFRGNKDIREYTKELTSDLQEAQDKVAKLNKQAEDYKEYPGVAKFVTKEEVDNANALVRFLELLLEYLSDFKKKSNKSSHTTDPFITQMQNRIKFMQDFKKGYDDLRKFLTDEQALGKEAGIMLGRGQSLNLSAQEQLRAAEDLTGWYSDMINIVEAKLRAMGVKGDTTSALLGFDTSKKSKAVQDMQKLLQSLWDAKTDFDTAAMKEKFEKALDALSKELKRSETAKNFYQDILGLTGDQQLAASLSMEVYGTPGDDLKKRIQDELKGTLDAIEFEPGSEMSDELKNAVADANLKKLMENIDKLPPKLADAVRRGAEAMEKYNADVAKSYAKLLMQYDEIKQEEVNITNRVAKDIATIEEGLSLEINGIRKNQQIKNKEAAEQDAKDRAAAAKDAVEAEGALQLFKLEDRYRMFFSSVGVISEKSAREVAQKTKKMLTDQFVSGKISLSKYKRELKEVNEQLKKYSKVGKFEKFASGEWGSLLSGSLDEVSDGLMALASTAKTNRGFLVPTEESKSFIEKINKVLNFGNFAAIFNGKKKIDILKEANAASQAAYRKEILAGNSQARAEAKATEAARAVYAKYSQQISDTSASFSEFATVLKALVTVLSKFGAGARDLFDELEKSGLDYDEFLADGMSDMADFYGMFADILSLDFGGAWSKYTHMMGSVRYYDRLIKRQSDDIDDLKYQYDRLEKAIAKAFGSDYVSNYNQQLENLYAQQEAYLKQAELERSKDKAKDLEKIKEYENNAREVGNQIEEMQNQLSKFFTGTDLTSAAKDFANAWIEAYKEFGSVTTAMEEKFQNMIQAMVENSLAAQIMQKMLEPIFDEVDRLAQESGELSAADIAAIGQLASEKIPEINDAMMTLMNTLSAAGVSLTAQPGNLTGISRNIAGASEESIVGLAAGINTQNFYMSYMPTISANVAAILMHLTGGTAETTGATPITPTNSELMMGYMSNIDANLAELLYVVRSVVSPKSAATNTHYVAVRQ